MKVANLGLPILSAMVRAVRKDFRQAIDRLALSGAHLIRMHFMTGRDLLDRLVAPQGFQRHTRLELACKPSPCRHFVFLRYPREYTLTTPSDFLGPAQSARDGFRRFVRNTFAPVIRRHHHINRRHHEQREQRADGNARRNDEADAEA